jgi:hypothetical protein
MDRVQAKTIQNPKKNLRCTLAAVKPDLCHTNHTRFAKRNTRCHSHQSSTNHSSIEQPSNQEGCIVFRYLGQRKGLQDWASGSRHVLEQGFLEIESKKNRKRHEGL